MKHYEPGTPRAGLGLAALAVTAITVGLLVFVPSHVESNGASHGTTEARHAVASVPPAPSASASRKNGARDHA